MILDDVHDDLERWGEEMMIENIDVIEHWARKLNIEYDELYQFVEERAIEIYQHGRAGDGKTALMSGWIGGFIHGWVAKERMKRGDP